MKYNVFAIVQAPKQEPVAIKYATGTNAIGAANAVTTILDDFEEQKTSPDSSTYLLPDLIEIKVEVV
jgi:hypothetical protein